MERPTNFGFLSGIDPTLAAYGERAELLCHIDPDATRVYLRRFSEQLTSLLADEAGLWQPEHDALTNRIGRLRAHGLLPPVVAECLHGLRMAGNAAAHGVGAANSEPPLLDLEHAYLVARWYERTVRADCPSELPDFVVPVDPGAMRAAEQEKMQNLREELWATREAAAELARTRQVGGTSPAASTGTAITAGAERARLTVRRAELATRATLAASLLGLDRDLDGCYQLTTAHAALPTGPAAAGRTRSPSGTSDFRVDELGVALDGLASSGIGIGSASPDVLAAFQRSSSDLADASEIDIRDYLRDLDEESITGVASNVKGILHEQLFVRYENADGDAVEAALFGDTNHPDTDVVLRNVVTGESWEVQLKATDQVTYVQEWIDSHPDGQIMVTDELATHMGLDSTGMSNADLEVTVNEFLDALDEMPEGSTVWRMAPVFSIVSLSLIVWGLWRRHQAGELSRDEFERRVAWATGWKVAKVGILALLMGIPGVNVVTSIVLVARFIVAVDSGVTDGRGLGLAATWFRQQFAPRAVGGGGAPHGT